MSPELLASAATFLASLAGLVRWAVMRIAKSHDDAATKSAAAQDRATDAIIKNTEITTRLVVKLDVMDTKIDRMTTPPKKHRTSPFGMRVVTDDE